MDIKDFLDISPEVGRALENGTPVVALESTIISHGMPYPTNLETANELESKVRENGAVPATTAVINGRIKLGLSEGELSYFAKARDVLKLSRMDLPYAIAKKLNGATTVAATMICARLGEIKVFATGGVGGVHRGVTDTFDVSTDLVELSKTPVLVVSAGVKSILDIPKTLEVFETLGVTLVGYQTDEFPSFYSRTSGQKLYMRVDTPKEAAEIFNVKRTLGIEGGMLVANPIAKDLEIPNAEIDRVIEKALKEAADQGVRGKATTPFLLSKIVEHLPEALAANVELAKSNAALAARIAVEMD